MFPQLSLNPNMQPLNLVCTNFLVYLSLVNPWFLHEYGKHQVLLTAHKVRSNYNSHDVTQDFNAFLRYTVPGKSLQIRRK